MTTPPEILEQIKTIIQSHGGTFDGVQDAIGMHLPTARFWRTGETLRGPDIRLYDVPFNPEKFNPKNFSKMVHDELDEETQMTKAAVQEKLTLVQKLHAVYEKIDHVDKMGENTSQHYKYVRAADVTHPLRKALSEVRVYAEVNFEFVGAPYTIARKSDPTAPWSAVNVKCFIVFHDLDSSDVLTSSGLGSGADVGDKAAYKAQTGALKYALKNAFLVADEAADPEADPNGSESTQEEPDFQAARQAAPKATAPAKAQAPAPAAAAPAPTPQPPAQAAPAAPQAQQRQPGDESEQVNNRPPTEAELKDFRTQFATLGDDLSTKGGLKASKGLAVNRKLRVFVEQTIGTSLDKGTKAMWDAFFVRIEAGKANPAVGLTGIAVLVNKANGIEPKAKS